jgi:maltose alpha-D-glucosyltransferase/alpha-amylase
MVTGAKLKGRKGTIVARPGKKLNKLLNKSDLPLNSQIINAEQFNTSIQFENRFLFKIFRNPEEGKNPEIEILKFLTETARFSFTPAFAGSMKYESPGQETFYIGVLMGYAPNEGTAWDLCRSFISQYFNKILTSSDVRLSPPFPLPGLLEEFAPEASGPLADLMDHFFLEMIGLLANRTGAMHLALASGDKDKDFTPEPFSTLYQKSLYQSFRTLIKKTVSELSAVRPRLYDDEEMATFIIENQSFLLDYIKSTLESSRISSTKTRIHGDFNLKQALFTGKDFILIDFEGEPVRTLSTRQLKYCPIRDVASMLSSFRYAIYLELEKQQKIYPGTREMLGPWVEPWYAMTCNRFLNSYLDQVQAASFIPSDHEKLTVLIRLYLIEKTVYEVSQELKFRMEYLHIPLQGLVRIIREIQPGPGLPKESN